MSVFSVVKHLPLLILLKFSSCKKSYESEGTVIEKERIIYNILPSETCLRIIS